MRLDHLLSKERRRAEGRSRGWIAVWLLRAERAVERVGGRGVYSPGRTDGRAHERPGVHGEHAEHGRNGGADGARRKRETTANIPVAMRLGETPVLIPNTMVKT